MHYKWYICDFFYIVSGISSTSKKEQLKLKNQTFSYSELHNITNGFETMIGKGGFGEVYLGTLQSGERVAVKKLSLSSNQGYKEFKSEVRCNNWL